MQMFVYRDLVDCILRKLGFFNVYIRFSLLSVVEMSAKGFAAICWAAAAKLQ